MRQRHRPASAPPGRGRAITRATLIIVVAPLLVILLSLCLGEIIHASLVLPGEVAHLRQREERPLHWSDLSPARQHALLVVEDPAFFQHHGVDLWTPGAGWTTLTQGLVKILYFKPFRPGLINKVRQTIAALVLDHLYSKQEQLDLFLNHAELGRDANHDVSGFEDAAETYFERHFAALDEQQYLSLLAMLMGPGQFSVRSHPRENAERVRRIQKLLAGRCQPDGFRDVLYTRCQ